MYWLRRWIIIIEYAGVLRGRNRVHLSWLMVSSPICGCTFKRIGVLTRIIWGFVTILCSCSVIEFHQHHPPRNRLIGWKWYQFVLISSSSMCDLIIGNLTNYKINIKLIFSPAMFRIIYNQWDTWQHRRTVLNGPVKCIVIDPGRREFLLKSFSCKSI